VHVRVEPSIEVKIAATLRIGEDLTQLGISKDGQWIHVRTAAGAEGWVAENLTKAVPAGQREAVLLSLIEDRAEGPFGFAAAVELIALIDDLRARAASPSTRADLALYRLRALRNAASYSQDRAAPLSEWFKTRREFIYNAFSGQWMLDQQAIMAEHALHAGTRGAEQMAWLAVTNGVPSDCEGDIGCYAVLVNRLEGNYLRLYPSGTYVRSALERILQRANGWRALQRDARVFTPDAHCPLLREPLAELRTAVEASKPPDLAGVTRTEVLRSLELVGDRCK
jgi:hypothetical protein